MSSNVSTAGANTMAGTQTKAQKRTRYLVISAMLSAVSIVLMQFDFCSISNTSGESLFHFAAHACIKKITNVNNKVYKSVIPKNVRLSEAPSFGEPISYYDKYSKGARAYQKLAKEVIKNIKK